MYVRMPSAYVYSRSAIMQYPKKPGKNTGKSLFESATIYRVLLAAAFSSVIFSVHALSQTHTFVRASKQCAKKIEQFIKNCWPPLQQYHDRSHHSYSAK